tara:strand:- start:6451 stop:6705 length:255 start_codon:yes stop_codon:yes gene_type:complete
MSEENKLQNIVKEMKDLEIVRDLLNEVISLKQYKGRLNESQEFDFGEHVKAVQKYSSEGNQSRIKYHLTCAKRLLDSAKDWDVV